MKVEEFGSLTGGGGVLVIGGRPVPGDACESPRTRHNDREDQTFDSRSHLLAAVEGEPEGRVKEASVDVHDLLARHGVDPAPGSRPGPAPRAES
jgi:hypothetical protein